MLKYASPPWNSGDFPYFAQILTHHNTSLKSNSYNTNRLVDLYRPLFSRDLKEFSTAWRGETQFSLVPRHDRPSKLSNKRIKNFSSVNTLKTREIWKELFFFQGLTWMPRMPCVDHAGPLKSRALGIEETPWRQRNRGSNVGSEIILSGDFPQILVAGTR